MLPNTLHKAIRRGRLHQARNVAETAVAPTTTKSERSEMDSTTVMGYATQRSEERVAASLGALTSAPIRFEAAQDVPHGGVLLALLRFSALPCWPMACWSTAGHYIHCRRVFTDWPVSFYCWR